MKIELKRLDIICGRDYTHGLGKMEGITGIDMSHRIFTLGNGKFSISRGYKACLTLLGMSPK